MADYLPDLVEADARIDDIKEEIVEEEEEEKEEKEEEKEDEEIPVVEPRKKISQDEVFTTPKVKPVAPLEEQETPAQKKKQKRPLSEKQKAHLAKIRKKGQETLKKRREEKQKALAEGKPPPCLLYTSDAADE